MKLPDKNDPAYAAKMCMLLSAISLVLILLGVTLRVVGLVL